MLESSTATHEQKFNNFLFQPHFVSDRLLVPNVIPDLHTSYEYDHSVRTLSPAMSHYSSTLSESSASSEHISSPGAMSQSTPFIPRTTAFPGHHTYKLPDPPLQQHMIWQPQPHSAYNVVHSQSDCSFFNSPQASIPLSDIEMAQHADEAPLGVVFDTHPDQIQSHSPGYMPQPQELEYEEHENSEISTPTEDLSVATPTSQTIQVCTSRDETEEEEVDEDHVIVDDDSDSDYDNRCTRRRMSRTTSKQKHSRKSSTNTIISPAARVHKRSSSAATVTSTSSISVSRSHRARSSSSKSIRTKSKGPNFPSAKLLTPVPKSERTYPCTFHRFGCTSEFPNKNEWKRHVACQHLQLGYYRCDMDGCNPDTCQVSSTVRPGRRTNARTSARPRSQPADSDDSNEEIVKYYNDFNRKDLFTQHCRRMHGPTRNPALCSRPPSKKNGQLCPTREDEVAFEAQLIEIRARCWHVRRPAPSRSSCGFCLEVFDADYDNSSSTSTTGSNGKDEEENEEKKWEERMEHVGKHYEKEGADREEEKMDEDLVEWGLKTGVLRYLPDGRPWLISVDDPTMEGQTDATTEIDAGSRSRGYGRIKVTTSGDETTSRRKARRQPSRTAVVQRRVSFKEEDIDDTTVMVSLI